MANYKLIRKENTHREMEGGMQEEGEWKELGSAARGRTGWSFALRLSAARLRNDRSRGFLLRSASTGGDRLLAEERKGGDLLSLDEDRPRAASDGASPGGWAPRLGEVDRGQERLRRGRMAAGVEI